MVSEIGQRKPIELLIFDCDGVLVDSEPVAEEAFIEMVHRIDTSIPAEKAVDAYRHGGSLEDSITFLVRELGMNLPDDFARQYRVLQYDALTNRNQTVPQIETALSALNKRKCVASGGPMEKININLKGAKLDMYFKEAKFSSYDIGSWKPEPGLFLHAARQMEVEPKKCLVIEDSVIGVQAALAAGMRVLGYAPNKETAKLLKQHGAQIFNSMLHLPYLVFVLESGGSNSTS